MHSSVNERRVGIEWGVHRLFICLKKAYGSFRKEVYYHNIPIVFLITCNSHCCN